MAENKALEDLFIAPFAVPRPPQRFYYIFQEPVRTAPEDLKDPARIAALYRQARSQEPHALRTCCAPGRQSVTGTGRRPDVSEFGAAVNYARAAEVRMDVVAQ